MHQMPDGGGAGRGGGGGGYRGQGPSGKVSTQKYLEKRWDKATFGNVQKSMDYHVNKHGKGLSPVEYTKQVQQCFNNPKAQKTDMKDLLGRDAVKVISPDGTGLFTPQGKIIWFQPYFPRVPLPGASVPVY